jgi:hypothetical protein
MLPRPVRDEASQGSTASVRVAEREGIHADTVPRPVRDDASQGSTALVEAQAGWPSEKDSCKHAATASP